MMLQYASSLDVTSVILSITQCLVGHRVHIDAMWIMVKKSATVGQGPRNGGGDSWACRNAKICSCPFIFQRTCAFFFCQTNPLSAHKTYVYICDYYIFVGALPHQIPPNAPFLLPLRLVFGLCNVACNQRKFEYI